MRRSVLLAIAPAVIAALLPLSASGAVTPPAPPIIWTPCAQDAGAECGTLKVPIDWDDPGEGSIDLALARRKATGRTTRIGSLVINPGGPGISGVDFILSAGGYFSGELTSRFDIVGFDPRGVGRSNPVVCSSALLAEGPHPLIRSQAELEARLAYNRRLREDCRARTGPLFDHVSSLSVARDLDALRAALGEEKLTYYGGSYGTLIGQLYAERFPHRVRALALDGNFDHSLGTAAYLDTAALHAEGSFDEFAAWCTRTATCALHGKDVRAFWADLRARADRGELHRPGQPAEPMTSWDLTDMAFAAFYGPNWAELAELLLAVDTGEQPPSSFTGPQPDGAVSPFPRAVYCQDFHLPVRDYREYAAHLGRQSALARDMRFSPAALGALASCLGQPTPLPNPQHRLRVEGSPPILLANSLHDPASGYLWAVSTAQQIGHEARLLTYEGAGHGVYGRSDCTTETIDRYLTSLVVPAPGARCPAVSPPDGRARLGVRHPSLR
ncbi:alpha/beta hydrolase [Nonomuraea dietziae]|uniref:Pimeloyl-ACP methyl ester carboxylesterase n=2 Tax=Nonomuraea dietziae TaxID=65515 RepID=A0A7W5VJP7_9ACTN|nr:alpha/beta hydrolase [Nonomuraea dietziae]MBB3733258.1 pimeloyl-ACP methyl ester carboxylesterase [Nonomuraea dietziae]